MAAFARRLLVGLPMAQVGVEGSVTLMNCLYGYSQCLGLQPEDGVEEIKALGCATSANGEFTGNTQQNIANPLSGTNFVVPGSQSKAYQDGMPCTFSPGSDWAELEALKLEDISIMLENGQPAPVHGAMWMPAIERNEQRTLLTFGYYGFKDGTTPANVTIKGSTYSGPGLQYSNQGEEIVWARWYTAADHKALEGGATWRDWFTASSSCQSRFKDVTHVVQVVFNGGMTITFSGNTILPFPPHNDFHKFLFALNFGGRALSDAEYLGFVDEADGDNIVDLCLKLTPEVVAEIQEDAVGIQLRFRSTRDCVFAVPPKGDCLNDLVGADCGDSGAKPQEICVSDIPGATAPCNWAAAKEVTLTAEDVAELKNCNVSDFSSGGHWFVDASPGFKVGTIYLGLVFFFVRSW